MIVSFRFPMHCLNRDRDIVVYLPDDYYYSNERYPVVFINDGQNAFFDCLSFMGVSWGFLDYVKKHDMKVILVAITCNFEGFKRIDEYGPWRVDPFIAYSETHCDEAIGGEGKLYVNWLIKELKPYIDRRFRTNKSDCAIVGSSMGGVISAYAALAYPCVFNKCAALSTAFWFYRDEFRDLIEGSSYGDDFYFYFDLGEFEGCGNRYADKWYPISNMEIFDLLKDKVKCLRFHYFEGEYHNEEAWAKRVPLFMDWFFGRE